MSGEWYRAAPKCFVRSYWLVRPVLPRIRAWLFFLFFFIPFPWVNSLSRFYCSFCKAIKSIWWIIRDLKGLCWGPWHWLVFAISIFYAHLTVAHTREHDLYKVKGWGMGDGWRVKRVRDEWWLTPVPSQIKLTWPTGIERVKLHSACSHHFSLFFIHIHSILSLSFFFPCTWGGMKWVMIILTSINVRGWRSEMKWSYRGVVILIR